MVVPPAVPPVVELIPLIANPDVPPPLLRLYVGDRLSVGSSVPTARIFVANPWT